MSIPNRTVAVMAAVIIIQSVSLICMGLMTATLPAPTSHGQLGVEQAQFEECIKGWHDTIDTLNATTAQLNKMTAAVNHSLGVSP